MKLYNKRIKTMESESQVQSISVIDLKKRLKDVKGERYALNGLASQKSNKKSTEDNKYLSPVNKNAHSVNNSEYNFHQSYPDKRVGQVFVETGVQPGHSKFASANPSERNVSFS